MKRKSKGTVYVEVPDKITQLINYSMILYGDIFADWLNKEGIKLFIKWAKKRGIEYNERVEK